MNCRIWSVAMMALVAAGLSLPFTPAQATPAQATPARVTGHGRGTAAVAPFVCHVASTLGGQYVAVERQFTPDGQDVLVGPRPSDGVESPAAHTVRAGLNAYIDTLRADLPGNCPLRGADGEYRLHEFVCDPVLRVSEDVYLLANGRAGWWRDDPAFRMQLDWLVPPGHDFATQGLPPHSEWLPVLIVDRPREWPQRNFGVEVARGQTEWTYREAFEVRVGRRVFRDWTTSNVMVNVPWAVWPDLLAGEGDIVITVYDRDDGVLVQRTFPHGLFAITAARLAQLQARMGVDESDPVTRCPVEVRTEGWETEIIVT